MTKVWDPNHAATINHPTRGQRNYKPGRRRKAITRRDGFMSQARTIARTQNLGQELKIAAVRGYVDRAKAAAPISQRQVAGLIELLGRSSAEKVVGHRIWL